VAGVTCGVSVVTGRGVVVVVVVVVKRGGMGLLQLVTPHMAFTVFVKSIANAASMAFSR